MRKSVVILILFTLLSVFSNRVIASEKEPAVTKVNSTEIPADVKILLDRIAEIKAMDKSALNSVERKELRSELREIKSTLRSNGNGIYISTGAIIIILLLIIIL